MDRVTTVLSQHRMLPFVLPTLACLCWLTGCTQTTAPEITPAEPVAASSGVSDRPELPTAAELARADEHPEAVMPASFPQGHDVWKRLNNDVWHRLEDTGPRPSQDSLAPARDGEPSTIAIHKSPPPAEQPVEQSGAPPELPLGPVPELLLTPGPLNLFEVAAEPDPPPAQRAIPDGRSPQPLAQPPTSSLAPPENAAPRSGQLEQLARQADRQIRHGYQLAGRRAYYSARAEFIGALRLIAQGLDTERQTSVHSRCLAAGLTAVREADDFLPQGSRLEADLNLAGIVGGHRTPVLAGADVSNLTPMSALRLYLTFAQEQLATAAGGEVAASMALHALAKLHAALATGQPGMIRAADSKAMLYYQAAIFTYPKNYLAANDLGVLLARAGSDRQAHAMLRYSLSLHGQSSGWRNLAAVSHRLGQQQIAQHARQRLAVAMQTEAARRKATLGGTHPAIRWVDPATFAKTADNHPLLRQPPAAQPGAVPPNRAGPSQTPPPPQRQPPPTATRPGFWPWPEPKRNPLSAYISRSPEARSPILLCQALGPAAPCPICAVDCSACDCSQGWEAARMIAWQAYAQGEYVGHFRLPHVSEYRLRVDDELDLIYRLTREETATPYKLNVGDQIQVESFTDEDLNRELLVQPDGTITLRLLGQVHATRLTVTQLRDDLERRYKKYYNVPAITVTPLRVNTKLEDLRASVDRRQGIGGQSQLARVTPEGSIALPALGSVYVQGLTLDEARKELAERYRREVEGIEVIPVLVGRAPRYVYVLGEVGAPGRFDLTGPTTLLQSLAMAGSWNNGAHLRQIVVLRRGDDWRMLATMVDVDAILHARKPCSPGEIWLNDSDVVIVPKSPILVADDFIELVFTRGIYGVFPLNATLNFAKLSSL